MITVNAVEELILNYHYRHHHHHQQQQQQSGERDDKCLDVDVTAA